MTTPRLVATGTKFSNLGLDRFQVDSQIDAYVCTYSGSLGGRQAAVNQAVEVGVNLDDGWSVRGSSGLNHPGSSGTSYVIGAGELYDVGYGTTGTAGRSVLFTFMPGQLVGIEEPGREIRIGRGPLRDQRLLDLAQELARMRERGEALPLGEVRNFLVEMVNARGALTGFDPLMAARNEIDRFFDRGLYLHHFADVARMSPTQFLRSFKRRYGLTPIQYRLRLQLEAASVLGWKKPELRAAEIAQACGITHMPYFFRLFKRYFGTTPERHRQAA